MNFKRVMNLIVSTLLIMALCITCMSTIAYGVEYEMMESDTEVVEPEELVIDQTESIVQGKEDVMQPFGYDEPSYPTGFKTVDLDGGIFYIKNIGNSKYIDIHGPNTDMIHQWTYHSGLAENWQIIKQSNGTYVIKSLYKNKYIGIANTNTGVANINLYSTISGNTSWVILKNLSNQYIFVPCNNISYVLCAPNASTGSELQLASAVSSNNYTKWEIIEQEQLSTQICYIQNIGTDRFPAPYGSNLADGTRIHQWDFSTASGRKWTLEIQSDYCYTIKNQYTQKYIGIAQDSDGTIYIEQFSTVGDSTKWKIYLSESENYIFVPKEYEPYSCSMSVDPLYNNYGSVLQLVTYTNNSNYKDEWRFIDDCNYLGVLDVEWHSDEISAGYWDLDGGSKSIDVYMEKLNNDTNFQFLSGCNVAISQWENALSIDFNTVSTKSGSDLEIYGGTREEIEQFSGRSNTTWSGLTVWTSNVQGIMRVGDTNKVVYISIVTFAKVYIIHQTNFDTLRKTSTHEIGHAIGYFGHSPDSTDVMYKFSHESYDLKECEKNCIMPIYTLFNK